MKSKTKISLIVFIAIFTFTAQSYSAQLESLFLHSKVKNGFNFKVFTDNLTSVNGIIDSYYNPLIRVVTVIYDKDIITETEILDKYRKFGYKILMSKTNFISKFDNEQQLNLFKEKNNFQKFTAEQFKAKGF